MSRAPHAVLLTVAQVPIAAVVCFPNVSVPPGPFLEDTFSLLHSKMTLQPAGATRHGLAQNVSYDHGHLPKATLNHSGESLRYAGSWLREASYDDAFHVEALLTRQPRRQLKYKKVKEPVEYEAMFHEEQPPPLGPWGHVSQLLPVVVILVWVGDKLHQTFFKRVSSSDARPFQMRQLAEMFAAFVLYMLTGPSVILLNRHIMMYYHFHFPITLASLGNVFLAIYTRMAVASGHRQLHTSNMDWPIFLRVVVPVNIFNFATQVLGLCAYLFISVPEIQILKSATVLLVLLLAVLVLGERVSNLVVVSVIVIAGGVCASAVFDADTQGGIHGGMDAQGAAQALGVTLTLAASFCEASKIVASQLMMNRLSVFDALYWSSPSFSLMSLPFIVFFELHGLACAQFSLNLVSLLIINALLTGLTVLSTLWLVKFIGALTLKVMTQSRSILLILASVIFSSERCSGPQYVGYAITLAGMGVFDHARQALDSSEARSLQPKVPPASP